MTIISRPVKLVDCYPEVSEPTMIYSGGVIDFFEARRRLSAEFERDKETETKLRHGKAVARHKYSGEPASPLKPAFYGKRVRRRADLGREATGSTLALNLDRPSAELIQRNP